MTLQAFIKQRPYLVWSVKDLSHLSESAITEAVLNYGDFDDVKKLIAILGMKKTAAIFRKQTTKRRRVNYNPKIANYFKLYFEKYAR